MTCKLTYFDTLAMPVAHKTKNAQPQDTLTKTQKATE